MKAGGPFLKGNKTALPDYWNDRLAYNQEYRPKLRNGIEVQDEHTDAWTGIFEEALPKG